MSDTITVYIEPLENCSPKILQQLKLLTRREYGCMKNNIKTYFSEMPFPMKQRRIKTAYAYYVIRNKKVISWAMLYKESGYYNPKKSSWSIDTYTKKAYRNQGYASTILSVVKQNFKGKMHAAGYLTTLYRGNRFITN